MKPFFHIFLVTTLLSCLSYNAVSQSFFLKQNQESGIYKTGETIYYSAIIEGNRYDSIHFTILKNNTSILLKKSILPNEDSTVLFSETFDEACSVMIEAKIGKIKQSTGSIFAPEKLKPGAIKPKDFDQYWNHEKKELRALKMEIIQKKTVVPDSGFVCFDTELNCTGPKPARGYFAKPRNAKAKSLPIVLLVHAAGVKGSWCRSEINDAVRYAQMGNGALCFDLNAHGMLNGQTEEYYSNLEIGELKNYFLSGLENRDSIYFRGMYLRLIRTLDFLTQQTEWDGKRIIVIGESQGGGQALVAAGLDNRVSAVVATVPAMCDFGGTLANRKGGWPQPFDQKLSREKMKNTLPYFDAAHHLENSKAELVVEIGLIDQVCPSTSIYAAINQAKGKKIIYPVTYRNHGWPNSVQRINWDATVFEPKNTYVQNYLK